MPLRPPSRDDLLTNDTYIELVRTIFAMLLPSVVMTALFAGVGIVAIDATGDPVLIALTVAGTIASLVRLTVVIRTRSGGVQARIADRASAMVHERVFAASYIMFAVLLGLFCARVIGISAPIGLHMLVAPLMVGYSAGVAAGVWTRPSIAGASMFFAVVPSALVGISMGDIYHRVLAIMLLALLGGGFQNLRARYRAQVEKIEFRHVVSGLARRDHLTGLSNRLGLAEAFAVLSNTLASNEAVAVHCLDLDRFKPVNDRHGHPVGDALLRTVAKRLSAGLKQGDCAARIGGDEFVVLQRITQRADEAETLAHRLVDALGQPYCVSDVALSIGVSVGFAISAGGETLDDLLAQADNALYAIKAVGGGAAGHSGRRVGKVLVQA